MTSNRSFLRHTHILPQTNGGRISNFIVSLSSTSYMRVFILVLHHKDNKLLSIYANIKSQDDFIQIKTKSPLKGFYFSPITQPEYNTRSSITICTPIPDNMEPHSTSSGTMFHITWNTIPS